MIACNLGPSIVSFSTYLPTYAVGLGITSLDAEYNLKAIAQAHGGTYCRVDPPNAPRR
jgi:hypothetical protein